MKNEVKIKTYGFSQDEDSIIENILIARGIKDPDRFLYPDDDEILPAYETPRMNEGIELIAEHLNKRSKFFLSVDSDTDGITSGAIMYKWLCRHTGAPENIGFWVSKGKSHGTSEELVEAMESFKPDLLIVMDSLDGDTKRYQQIRDMGIDILVLDHHDVREEIGFDDVVVLVSSNRSKNEQLSGAGVVWRFCCEAEKDLLLEDYSYSNLADLAATGIVADMVLLDEDHMENRFIVAHGLDHLVCPTLKEMTKGYSFDSNAIIFSVAPLINAACRYLENDTAFQAFISEDLGEIKDCIKALKNCRERQNEEVNSIKEELNEQIEAQKDDPFLFLTIDTEYGIAGLIANQILTKYQKPVFVVKCEEKGYKGSGRSIGVNLRELSHNLVKSSTGFGHPQAFGFSVDYKDYEDFREKLAQSLEKESFTVVDEVDCQVDAADLSQDLIDLSKAVSRISGQGFKQLTYMCETDGLEVRTTANEKHLIFDNGKGFLFIKWNAGEQFYDLYENFTTDTKVRFIGSLDSGFFGRKYNRRLILERFEILE